MTPPKFYAFKLKLSLSRADDAANCVCGCTAVRKRFVDLNLTVLKVDASAKIFFGHCSTCFPSGDDLNLVGFATSCGCY